MNSAQNKYMPCPENIQHVLLTMVDVQIIINYE